MAATTVKHDSKENACSCRITDFDAIGMDLDHTLCKYNLDKLFPLLYKSYVKHLVEDLGYDKEIARPIGEDKDFITKGLVYDTDQGNFFKFSEDGYILRASHGTTPLTDAEVEQLYGKQRLWEHFDGLKATLKQNSNVRFFENYFDMPGALLYARMVDLADKKAGKRLYKYSFNRDISAAFEKVYRRQAFAEGTGGYFPAYKSNPLDLIQPCSNNLKKWLTKLKNSGKILFLMTSSNVDYAVSLLEHTLGSDWQRYFHVSLFYARKPGFFTEEDAKKRPFLEIKATSEGKETVDQLELGKCYSQGNVHLLMEFFKRITGKSSPKVMYIGDSLRSDIFPPTRHANWTTVAILEEMEVEGMMTYKSEDEDDGQPILKKLKLIKPVQLEVDMISSKQWGSFFVDKYLPATEPADDHKGFTAMNTLWGYFIKKYATFAVPQLDYISELPLDHKFHTFSHPDTKLGGFYPSIPKSLEEFL